MGMGRVASDNEAPFAVGPEILTWIKTETAKFTEAAHTAAPIFGTVGLRCIFDYCQLVLAG